MKYILLIFLYHQRSVKFQIPFQFSSTIQFHTSLKSIPIQNSLEQSDPFNFKSSNPKIYRIFEIFNSSSQFLPTSVYHLNIRFPNPMPDSQIPIHDLLSCATAMIGSAVELETRNGTKLQTGNRSKQFLEKAEIPERTKMPSRFKTHGMK